MDRFTKLPLTVFNEGNMSEMKPNAIIVDLDGTVANNNNRHPYHFKRCIEDNPNTEVIDIVRKEHARGTKVVILTGRPKSNQELSCQWLTNHGVPFDECYFKPDGDFRKGWKYKDEVIHRIISQYNVLYFLDDDLDVHGALCKHGLNGIRIIDNIPHSEDIHITKHTG